MSRTVSDLIDELRSQVDEFSSTNLTEAQILSAFNRGQRNAANITARKYEDLFWKKTTATTVSGQREYDIPSEAYGRRVEMLEVEIGGIAYKIKRISNHKKSAYVSSSTVQRPYYYTLTKNKFELYPTPSGGVTINVHYNDAPERLVTPQGQITSINSASNYVIVDSVGSDLATTTSGFASYVNFVDRNTGEVKGSCQISAINATTGQLTFKSAGLTRSTVLGQTISTSLPSDLTEDDYLCIVTGTCVPELPDAYTDYLIQYAVVEIRRRFGEPTNEEYAALKELESELLKMWAGREARGTVRKASNHWRSYSGSLRRLFS